SIEQVRNVVPQRQIDISDLYALFLTKKPRDGASEDEIHKFELIQSYLKILFEKKIPGLRQKKDKERAEGRARIFLREAFMISGAESITDERIPTFVSVGPNFIRTVETGTRRSDVENNPLKTTRIALVPVARPPPEEGPALFPEEALRIAVRYGEDGTL